MKTRRFKIQVAYNLFHNSGNPTFATCAVVCIGNRVRFGKIELDEDKLSECTKSGIVHNHILQHFRKSIADSVRNVLNDPDGLRYPIRWNEDTCLECTFKEL